MSKFDELFERFKARQNEIVDLHAKLKSAQDEAQREVDALMEKKKEELKTLEFDFNNAREKYKAEMKTELGICDGETLNILDTIHAIKKVIEMQ